MFFLSKTKGGQVMASEAASRLKDSWMEMPVDCFEPLTFGELSVGQKFIGLPLPGDNLGHGGFRGTAYIFIKTDKSITEARAGLPYGIPHGRAKNISRDVWSDFPNSMHVICVK